MSKRLKITLTGATCVAIMLTYTWFAITTNEPDTKLSQEFATSAEKEKISRTNKKANTKQLTQEKTTLTENRKPVVSQPSARQKWRNLLPILRQAKQQRYRLYIEHVNQIRELLRQTDRNLKVNEFTESMLGLEAMFKTTSSRQKVERYISKQYALQVLDSDALLKEIQKIFDSFNTQCAKLDDQLLIACQIDVAMDPSKIAACKIDWKLIQNQLDRLHSKLTDELYTTVKESLVATGVGVVAGGFGAQLGRELGKDSKGNTTLASQILGFVGAIAAEQLAEEVTLDLLETRKRIRRETKRATSKFLFSLVGNGNKFGGVEFSLYQICRNHDSLMLKTISRELKLDPAWVNKNLPK